MENNNQIPGYKKIYQDLLKELKGIDIEASCENLRLILTDSKQVEIPFMGEVYLVSKEGVKHRDEYDFYESVGSVLIHYLQRACMEKPANQFVTFATLAGPLFRQGGYSASALEMPLAKRFGGKVPELLSVGKKVGGRMEGEAGLGGISIVFDLLPNIPIQLVFYDRDEEFPPRATLLFDKKATRFLEFEFLAVLVSIFVHGLCRMKL